MRRKSVLRACLGILVTGAVIGGVAFARGRTAPVGAASPIHPTFALLDESGGNVLDANTPVSTMRTCGQCHDTDYIASHSFHADLGLSEFGTVSAHSWDLSDGPFGKWNPLTYGLLSAAGDELTDLGTAEWIMANAERFVGGGPGVTSRTGAALPTGDPDTENWDWEESGTLEMNCFVCHLADPNQEARVQAIRKGDFREASTATLLGTGIVSAAGNAFTWNTEAFAEDGTLAAVAVQNPTSDNCAQCHGLVDTTDEALVVTGCSLDDWQTATTGQVISPDRISASGVNLADKETLSRSWDIHAERGLECTDCHYSLNNPAYYQSDESPASLIFDPRRLEIGEYLQRPDHNFARGQSAQTTVAPELKGTMRRCESCHDSSQTHTWLPYAESHMQQLACESCHVPQLYAPAVQSYDWTVLSADGEPISTCRGVEGTSGTVNDLVTGFTPILLSRQNIDGQSLLAPYNLVAAWYWVYDDPQGARPVRLEDLQSAYFDGGAYAPEVVTVLDSNADGGLSDAELVLDTEEKAAAIAGRLSAHGLANPHIEGEVQPYSVNHNVAAGEAAIKDCTACHADDSRLTQPMILADRVPGGVVPEFVSDANTRTTGELAAADGMLTYTPDAGDQNLYIFGLSRVGWIDGLGGIMFLGVLAAVVVHGGLRFYSALKAPRQTPELKRVYMYAVYERFWHWLQTFAIVLLLITGLIIHRPEVFGFLSFPAVVTVHNVIAVLLVINAGLSLFYHLVSGEIRQYLPRPYGFFDDAFLQAKYYLRGIFKGDGHPFEKRPEKKLNPLQQLTYFAILNILLPLQILTGALMMGVQVFPQVSGWLGGLPFLAPFHSLVAWTFAAFIVAHVYLTTTGPRPLTSLKAMMNGWEDVEAHPHAESGSEPNPEKESK